MAMAFDDDDDDDDDRVRGRVPDGLAKAMRNESLERR
jgi:hypothetical protein